MIFDLSFKMNVVSSLSAFGMFSHVKCSVPPIRPRSHYQYVGVFCMPACQGQMGALHTRAMHRRISLQSITLSTDITVTRAGSQVTIWQSCVSAAAASGSFPQYPGKEQGTTIANIYAVSRLLFCTSWNNHHNKFSSELVNNIFQLQRAN